MDKNWQTTIMTFKESVKNCLKKYVSIKGRASRSEYWWFQLFIYFPVFLGLALALLFPHYFENVCLTFIGFWMIALMIPDLCVTVRRLHDSNRSGCWIFIALIPYVGQLVFFILMVVKGSEFNNKYDLKPKNSDCSKETIDNQTKENKESFILKSTEVNL